jgi:hypothetical protein
VQQFPRELRKAEVKMSIESPRDKSATEWEQFRELTELHKFYFEHIIKATAFGFAVIGAIVSYVIATDMRDRQRVAVALAIPILLCIASCLIAVLGAVKLRELSRQVHRLQRELGLSWRPHAELLPLMSWSMAVLFFVTACGLVIVVLDAALLPNWNGPAYLRTR